MHCSIKSFLRVDAEGYCLQESIMIIIKNAYEINLIRTMFRGKIIRLWEEKKKSLLTKK